MKFKLWIEIKQTSDENNWSVSYCIHDGYISKEEFFIENYPINYSVEGGTTYFRQYFKFNKKLHSIIQKLLLPKSNKNYFEVNKETAWNYYHYTLYVGGFTFAVHPISMSNDFLRQEFEGTQEEIYNKCLQLNKEWISKNKQL